MKNYVKPVVEIVEIETADVITASLGGLFTNVNNPGIEDGGNGSRVVDMTGYETRGF
ncbi:MAG: hypothetical protein IIV97_04480 [Oscillospiraceae bacterium]|nr:hypothetical protein [Oscillospiraceae bacterium]